MNEVWIRWGGVLTATAVAIPALVVLIAVTARLRRRRGVPWPVACRDAGAEWIAVAGTLPWLWMTLTPSTADRGVRLVPLVDLAELFGGPPGTIVVQLVGNLLVFAAAGFCLPVRFRLRPWMIALGAAAGSTLIEATQYLADLGRVSSVDDVLLNTCGAVLAAWLARPWWRARDTATRHNPCAVGR